jgi:DNA polymerase IV
VIPPDKGEVFVEDLPVGKFHGIGPKTAEKMNRLGIHTGADLKAQSMDFLEQYFGKAGTWYFAIARGEDDRRVVPNRPRKSVGSETTFMEDLGRPKDIEQGVASVLDDVWSYCERTGILGRTVTVKIKYADFQIVTRSRTLNEPVASRAVLEQTSIDLVRSIYPLQKNVRLLGVSLHNLAPRGEPATEPQMTLEF